MARRPLPLRGVLLLVNLAVFMLPLGAIGVLRLYESELIRQTESELVAQGAFVAAAYRYALLGSAHASPDDDIAAKWDPKPARLDVLGAKLYPSALPGLHTRERPSLKAQAAGKELSSLLTAANRITLAGIRVVDERGLVVASSGSELGLDLSNRVEVQQALSGKDTRLLRRRGSAKQHKVQSISRSANFRVVVALPIAAQDQVIGAVILSRTPENLRKALYQNRENLALSGLFLLFMVILFSVGTALTLGRPLRALIQQSRALTRGDAAALKPLEKPGTQEVQELSEALVHMAKAYEKQKQFLRRLTSMIGHELKTPLTAMNGSLELLQDHGADMSHEERQEFYGILQKNSARLSKRIFDMLTVAKAEMGTYQVVESHLPEILEGLKYSHPQAKIHLDLDAHLPPVKMPPEITTSILSHLIDNAHLHGGPDIQVKLEAQCQGSDVMIQVIDNGVGIPEAAIPHLFEPQYSTAKERGGSGLGLAMAQDLAQLFDAELRHHPSDTGAIFSLTLKGAQPKGTGGPGARS